MQDIYKNIYLLKQRGFTLIHKLKLFANRVNVFYVMFKLHDLCTVQQPKPIACPFKKLFSTTRKEKTAKLSNTIYFTIYHINLRTAEKISKLG